MNRTLEKLRNREPTTIVAVGDSTSIETMWTFGRRNWCGHLAEALWARYGDGFIWVINSSQCGNSYEKEFKRIDTSILRFAPDLVILSMGTGGTEMDDAILDAYRRDTHRFVARVRDACGSEFLFRTFNPVVYGYWENLPQGAVSGEAFDAHPRGERLAQTVVELAGELGCPVVDHYTLWKQHEKPFAHPGANPQGLCMRMADTVHPNAVGHLATFRDMAPYFDVPAYFPWEEAGD